MNLFENGYIIGEPEKKLEDIIELKIKELSKIEKDANITSKTNKEGEKQSKYDYLFIGMISLEENNVITYSKNGFIFVFKVKEYSSKGEHLFIIKVHENIIESLDKMKNKTSQIITYEENNIKIWIYFLDKNKKILYKILQH